MKRRPDGRVHFVAPFPTLFNYGSVPDTSSEDGDPLDALVLGARVARGTELEGTVLGVVDFVDHGLSDPKLVVGNAWGPGTRALVEIFFRVYAPAKRWLDPGPGPTRFDGWLR
ncbi:MAG: inorganic diphosphatase [Myxococcales bacterium]|nr:inorganic diphosphatase [Myxococcales bacterium]